jgi:hypothetical protein
VGFGWHLGGGIRRPRVGVSGRRWDPMSTRSSTIPFGQEEAAANAGGARDSWRRRWHRMGARDGSIVDGATGIGSEVICSSRAAARGGGGRTEDRQNDGRRIKRGVNDITVNNRLV